MNELGHLKKIEHVLRDAQEDAVMGVVHWLRTLTEAQDPKRLAEEIEDRLRIKRQEDGLRPRKRTTQARAK